jgi:hypothetical protein
MDGDVSIDPPDRLGHLALAAARLRRATRDVNGIGEPQACGRYASSLQNC